MGEYDVENYACPKCDGVIGYKQTDSNGYATIYEAVCHDCGYKPIGD